MSKTKSSGLNHYEILFIVPNRFTDEEAKKLAAKVEKTLSDNGAQITKSEYWGKKKLAYPIKHDHYGYYSLCEFDLEGKNLTKIDNDLRLDAEVLRHQIVRQTVKSPEVLAKDAAIRAKIDSKKAKEEKEQQEEEKNNKPAAAKPKSKEAKEDKVELKDLDEKLEGILSANDLI